MDGKVSSFLINHGEKGADCEYCLAAQDGNQMDD